MFSPTGKINMMIVRTASSLLETSCTYTEPEAVPREFSTAHVYSPEWEGEVSLMNISEWRALR